MFKWKETELAGRNGVKKSAETLRAEAYVWVFFCSSPCTSSLSRFSCLVYWKAVGKHIWKWRRKVRLKDSCGLTYAEINKIAPIDNLKQGSLGKLYMDAKARLKKMTHKSKKVMHRSSLRRIYETLSDE